MPIQLETARRVGRTAVIGIAVAVGSCCALTVGGVTIQTWQEGQPDWTCSEIPEGLGPKQALQGLGVWRGVDTFPVQVRVPLPNGEFETHQANSADEFDPPYGWLDFDYGRVPRGSQVCFDRKRYQSTPTPQSWQRNGRSGHHVVYSRTGKR